MTTSKINEVIATSLGWKIIPAGKDSFGVNHVELANRGHETTTSDKLPNYTSDLNACHEMEEVLHSNYKMQQVYMSNLKDVCYRTKHSGQTIEFAMTNADGPQRCEAYLKTLGLWEE